MFLSGIKKITKLQKILLALSVTGIFCCLILCLPVIRQAIIFFAEAHIVHRNLTDTVWMKKILKVAVLGVLVLISFMIFVLFIVKKIPLTNDQKLFASQTVKISHRFFFVIICLWLALLSIRVSFVMKKEGFHVDEVLSIILASYNEFGWTKGFETDHVYSGAELKEALLWDNASISNSFADIGRLWKNNRDSPHTNLYYSFLRLWFTGVKTGNINYIIVRGCALNLFFFSISFLLFIRLLLLIFDDKKTALLGTALAFLNSGSISNTLFMRPYQLQETLFIFITYLFINIILNIRQKKDIHTWRNFIIISVAIAFTLLSGYFAILYIALLGCIMLWFLIATNQQNRILFWIFLFLFSLGIANIFYLQYLSGFTSYRAMESVSNLENKVLSQNFHISTVTFFSILHSFLFYTPILILFAINSISFAFRPKIKIINFYLCLSIIIAALFWSYIIIFISPIKELRYIMPIFPVISILFVLLHGKAATRNMFAVLYIIIFLAGVTLTYFNITSFAKVENLFAKKYQNYSVIFDSQLPVFIEQQESNRYIIAELIPYLYDNKKYQFIELNKLHTQILPENVFLILTRDTEEKISNDTSIKPVKLNDYFYYIPKISGTEIKAVF